jgi:SAM-dependent methyltransferase
LAEPKGRPAPDPTRRFSDRVADYVRYRPGYPEALLRALMDEAGLGPGSRAADVGSGTGISTELLLASGAEVWAVEPNAEMRAAAEERLGGEPRFHSVAGTAEATTLPDASADLVAAGQAFHWFDRERFRAECVRILRDAPPPGRVALFWNSRRTEATPFLRDYEALLRRLGTDYERIDHKQLGPEGFEAFFGGPYESRRFDNHQVFDFEGLRGRLLSSSYTPPPGHPGHQPMLAELRRIFDRHQEEGRVRFEYDTELHLGRLAPPQLGLPERLAGA